MSTVVTKTNFDAIQGTLPTILKAIQTAITQRGDVKGAINRLSAYYQSMFTYFITTYKTLLPKAVALRTEVADKDAQIEALTASSAQKDRQIEALTTSSADKDRQIEALTASSADKDRQIEALTASSAQKDRQIADFEARNADIEAHHGKLADDFNDLQMATGEALEEFGGGSRRRQRRRQRRTRR
jgi:chromosome segregation ATPase